ncbi:Histone-lysine N-methyltransferase [Bertholletia excelsa]
MLSERLPTVENACSFEEGTSSMDPGYPVAKLSESLQSCEPFSVTEEDHCKGSVMVDVSGTEVLVGDFKSFSIKSPEMRDDERQDKLDDPSKLKGSDATSLSTPRRSVRVTKSSQKTRARKAAKRKGKTVVEKPFLDSVLLNVARKRRSYFCKPSCSSVWGSLDIAQMFVESAVVDSRQSEQTQTRKARGFRIKGKHNKNQASATSQSSKEKNNGSSGRIRLKIKLGKEGSQSCVLNMVSITDNGLGSCWGTSSEVHKLDDVSQKGLKEERPGINGFQCCDGNLEKVGILSDAPNLGVCEKSAVVVADNHERSSSQTEIEGLGVATDNRYVDPGTSPHSEIVNLIPEARVNGKVQEDLHDVLISSSAYVPFGDITRLHLPQGSSKKEKRRDKLPHADGFNSGDRLPSPEINKASALEKQGQGEKIGDGFYSSEASMSTMTAIVSGNTSSSEGFSTEPLPSSKISDEITCVNLKTGSGTEDDLCLRLGDEHGSPESGISEKMLPCPKIKGGKHLKSSKSRGVRRTRSEVSESHRKGRGNASRKKGNPLKSIDKKNTTDSNGGCDGVFCEVDNHPEIGNHPSDYVGKSKIGDESTRRGIFNLELLPRNGEHYQPAHNAWVRCDDCLKWRRIPASLADSIEETNCKWTCKDNMDEGFANCSIPQEKSNAEINAELEISDASCEEDTSDAGLNFKRLEPKHSTVHQDSSWRLIKSNLFLHRSRKTQTIDEIMVCHCKLPPDGKMGCGDGCLNRMLNIECVQGTCPCGELCSNQQFQKRKYAKLKWFRCGKKGYGLQLLEDVSKGQFLIEYVGEVLDMQAYEARQQEYASKGHKHFYFMTLNGSEVIDACAKGNLGRFINHSCEPNCRTEKWMVNGEVCIGLFALRDMKKGEEVTFDYNYVRVFGAAAKKCACGSSQCRGFIGGNPLNTEVIVPGDSDEEYPEPVMVYEDGEIDDYLKSLIPMNIPSNGVKMRIAENVLTSTDKVGELATGVGHLENAPEIQTADILVKDQNETDKSGMDVPQLGITADISPSKSASDTKLQEKTYYLIDDESSKTISDVQQEFVQRSDTSSLTVISGKSLSETVDTKKKFDTIENKRASMSRPLMKTPRLPSSVKKGKLRSNSVNVEKPEMAINKSHLPPSKCKKIMDGLLYGRFEAVEEKLNELLDVDGGINKRKDAPKGYLKLLLLTATSGGSGNGEAIQSNRDLSMILDALLKTKSRMVLVDIINKNGLQMLHNMMKKYRRDFNKIPILRKLLKVLEYLATREILTLEHINSGPPCPGMESFRESILKLTDHDDKQVHQIARNFRDKWIPKPARKSSCMDRSDGRVEHHRAGSNCNRCSTSQNHWRDQSVKNSEAINCIKQSVTTNSVDGTTSEACLAPSSSDIPNSMTRTRKRKSRWDQPAETNSEDRSQHKEPKVQPGLLDDIHGSVQGVSQCIGRKAEDGEQNMDEDVPPGFSPRNQPGIPNTPLVTSNIHQEHAACANSHNEVVMGHPQGRFMNRLAVSYGIPLTVARQFGVPKSENLESWIVAPGVPFQPFPPLPPYPRDKREPPTCAGNNSMASIEPAEKGEWDSQYSDRNTPSTSGAGAPNVEIRDANNQHNFRRVGGCYSLGRRYFRQQKWNNSKLAPPWIRNRNGWGNNLRNGMYGRDMETLTKGIKDPSSSGDISTEMRSACNTFQHYPQQQN